MLLKESHEPLKASQTNSIQLMPLPDTFELQNMFYIHSYSVRILYLKIQWPV